MTVIGLLFIKTNKLDNLQSARAHAFKELHERPGIFIIPNPWDAGSAKMLASLGFEALTTTSAGLAFSLGRPDGRGLVTREETLANAKSIADAVYLPVAADLENCFADEPAGCAETMLLAAKAGLCGGSIEDATGRENDPIYAFELSVERVKAAVEAARSLPLPFVLTARAENFLHGRNDLNDTIRRLQAYAEAGADVLFAPGLKTRQDIETVVKAVAPRPVNVLMGISNADISLHELEDLGVKRVSLGSSLSRAAYGSFFNAARVLKEGRFDTGPEPLGYDALNQLFK